MCECMERCRYMPFQRIIICIVKRILFYFCCCQILYSIIHRWMVWCTVHIYSVNGTSKRGLTIKIVFYTMVLSSFCISDSDIYVCDVFILAWFSSNIFLRLLSLFDQQRMAFKKHTYKITIGYYAQHKVFKHFQ